MEKVHQFKGLVAAVVTPTYDDGSVNFSIIAEYAKYLADQGIKGIFVNGTQGEWSSFSVQERTLAAETWLQYGRDKFDLIIIHCGANSISDGKALAKHAESINADAVACIAPSFLKSPDEDTLASFLQEIAESAPKTAFLYYHLPWFTDVEVDVPVFLDSCHQKIPTFCGMKFTSHKLFDGVLASQYQHRKIKVFVGDDFQFLGALAMGLDAAVGSTYNYTAEQMNSVINCFDENDLPKAREMQMKCASVIGPILKKHGIGVGKILTKIVSGLDVGQPRLPLKSISSKDFDQIKKSLQENGFVVKV